MVMASGRVIYVSRNGGIIVVIHRDRFSVVQLLGEEGTFAIGDHVCGDWASEGGEPLLEGSRYVGHCQGTWDSLNAAVQTARSMAARRPDPPNPQPAAA
jgi:hypothetical protein